MGVVAALLAILGAFGLLSLLGSRFVNLCSVMPFLVLGERNRMYTLLCVCGERVRSFPQRECF